MTKELVSFQQTSKQGDLARGLGSLPLLIHILFDWQRRLSDKRRYGRRRSKGLAHREAVVKYPIVADRLFPLLVLKSLQNANRSTGEHKPGIGSCVKDNRSCLEELSSGSPSSAWVEGMTPNKEGWAWVPRGFTRV